MMNNEKMNAEVISVFPDKIRISVDDLETFKTTEKLKVGSYLRVSDNEDVILIAMIENFAIEVNEKEGKVRKSYIIEANPLGVLRDGKFERGGDTIAIPPKKVEPATINEIAKIYKESLNDNDKFEFCKLSSNKEISVPVNGNKFFNKHIAIVGSTGSGKSHTVSKIIQEAVSQKSGEFSLNNSHILIFDIHSEYKAAFPNSNYIDVSSLVLPYWLLTSEELEELFLDTEANDHNQRNVFKEAVISNRKENLNDDKIDPDKVHYDSPLFFDINHVLEHAKYKNEEKVQGAGNNKKQGSLYGKLTNFISRLENKLFDKRFDFLLGEKSKKISFEETLQHLLGYQENNQSNVTVFDLSGVPFEVLSITVSLISRIIFEYGYFYKRMKMLENPKEQINNDVPILLVYEEAHKYVPNSDLVKYRASKTSIERIAKEGRKYGVSLLLASQRPSEISETIFSQCNNFIAMRLTNPNDQNYVKKLLPDTLGNLVEKMPSLRAGEALLIGEAVVLPSIVQINTCDPAPSSSDIPYLKLWKEEWKKLDFKAIKDEWYQ